MSGSTMQDGSGMAGRAGAGCCLGRRHASLGLGLLVAAPWLAARRTQAADHPLYAEAVAQVTPPGGWTSRIALMDSVPRLVAAGVIDPDKMMALRRKLPDTARPLNDRLGLAPGHALIAGEAAVPAEIGYLLRWPAPAPIRLTRASAGHYLNLLWPLGLANRMAANEDSPIKGDMLARYASTSGWTLGRADNGAAYFNSCDAVALTPAQAELALAVAQSTYRPCCDNSTFFQDCNHGSALLGMLELGAAQGLSEDELFREALAFNSFWFPDNYLRTALYFKVVEKKDWAEVDPRIVMGARYSSLSMWQAQVQTALARIPNLIPEEQGGAGCGA